MNKKTKKTLLIIALTVWSIGAAGHAWVFLDSMLQERKLRQHQKILNAKIDKLDEVIEGSSSIKLLPEAVPDASLQRDIQKQFASSNASKPLILSGSTICLSLGTFFLIFQALIKAMNCSLGAPFSVKLKMFFRKNGHQKNGIQSSNKPNTANLQQAAATDKSTMKLGQYQGVERRKAERRVSTEKYCGTERRSGRDRRKNKQVFDDNDFLSSRSVHDFGNINTLYCDAESAGYVIGSNTDNSNDVVDPDTKMFDNLEKKIRETIASGYCLQAEKVDDSLKAQNEYLEKQISELKEMAQTVKEHAGEQTAVPDTSFNDLARQISAIREYAAQQQDKNEKLQEGYDWTIIRNFCLRFIRCIDNIENRMAQCLDDETATLEEIRDELIFALESSGIEQFSPEKNSDYCGQEKFAEVIHEKVKTEKPEDKGKIAEIIKPGYHYIVDEENTKVVRTAKVKLFE